MCGYFLAISSLPTNRLRNFELTSYRQTTVLLLCRIMLRMQLYLLSSLCCSNQILYVIIFKVSNSRITGNPKVYESLFCTKSASNYLENYSSVLTKARLPCSFLRWYTFRRYPYLTNF